MLIEHLASVWVGVTSVQVRLVVHTRERERVCVCMFVRLHEDPCVVGKEAVVCLC